MRKAMKRQLGREKQAQHLLESQESGFKAQEIDNQRRMREEQMALIQRASRLKKVEIPDSSKSKKALDKKQRVEKREQELDLLNEIEMKEAQRLKDIYEPDLERSDELPEIVEDYAKKDVDLTINLLEVLFPANSAPAGIDTTIIPARYR